MKEATATPMRAARLRQGLTQEELAAACRAKGVRASDSQLSKIERGLWSPRPKLRAALAEILGIDVLDLEAARQEKSA